MFTKNIIRENTYLDSIMLMSISSGLKQIEGVLEVSVIMGTEANKEILKSTGIQEVTTLIHKKGYGITQAIGVGGRDLSREVNGISMLQGIKALENDAATEVIILISKPPAPEVASLIFDTIRDMKKKYIINFLKGSPEEARKRGLLFASGLEEAAELAISEIEGREFIQSAFTLDEEVIRARAEKERKKLGKEKYIRGLFSGGTLADEALLILSRDIGDIHSNIPLKKELALKDSRKTGQAPVFYRLCYRHRHGPPELCRTDISPGRFRCHHSSIQCAGRALCRAYH